jgi:hypothetical protein
MLRPKKNPGDRDIMVDCGANLADNEWTHFAFTYDGTMLWSYCNGPDTASNRNKPGYHMPTVGSKLQLGIIHMPDPLFFDGLIDEFMIFDRALSKDEIGQIYELQK